MYLSVRHFSRSIPVQARRSIKDLRKELRDLAKSRGPDTPEDLQRYLFTESEATFGPLIPGDPTAYVNKVADDAFKKALADSGNDPRLFREWRENIKSRPEVLAEHVNPFAKKS
ncbi:hypothetical protein HMN09_00614400 [Mycena chlorophos]|uniref:Uncharacterized protein n=1 Tax=Mycena chlorophos TaxID=658473 RepID=A0A8H6T287_MYCCL|nr:hypothetical protein HMN09_00614400 [Mycena chlorophos]